MSFLTQDRNNWKTQSNKHVLQMTAPPYTEPELVRSRGKAYTYHAFSDLAGQQLRSLPEATQLHYIKWNSAVCITVIYVVPLFKTTLLIRSKLGVKRFSALVLHISPLHYTFCTFMLSLFNKANPDRRLIRRVLHKLNCEIKETW